MYKSFVCVIIALFCKVFVKTNIDNLFRKTSFPLFFMCFATSIQEYFSIRTSLLPSAILPIIPVGRQ